MYPSLFRALSMSTEQIVILILLVSLVVKLIFFDRNELVGQLVSIAAKETTPVAEKATQTETTAVANTIDKQNVPVIITNTDDDSENESTSDLSVEIEKELINDDEPRTLEQCLGIMNSEAGADILTDEEIKMVVKADGRQFPLHKIESFVDSPERGVKIRRQMMLDAAKLPENTLTNLPYLHFDYKKVMNTCCENVLGYVQIPVGYAGPLTLDGVQYYVPMATTEGALVASTNRGCKAISVRGVTSFVEDVGMTRAPCVSFPNIIRSTQAKRWMETKENFDTIKTAFDSTSRFARLQDLLIAMDGRHLYIRFIALTGDAMGMNMVSKGAEMALRVIQKHFTDMQIVSLSGNFCSDKKPAAVNWIKGRGKRVVCETIIPSDKLRSILKTNARTLVHCNKLKNLSGSAMAGSIGGNNAHAANMVTAVFIATGQDPAQNVTSSNCSTNMELCGENEEDLYLSCTMPSLEVGTVGGGTVLPGQGSLLSVLGIQGANATHPGENAKQLARIICATVMAGEISLMAALVTNDLVKSHMRHNR